MEGNEGNDHYLQIPVDPEIPMKSKNYHRQKEFNKVISYKIHIKKINSFDQYQQQPVRKYNERTKY